MPTVERRRMIGVALGPRDTAAALAALAVVARVADIAELRLDLMQELDLPRLLADRPCPVVVTCRPLREGGRYQGTEEDRVALLREAIRLGVEYVDVELDTVDQIGERGATRVIVSSHDYERMPPDFAGRWRELRAAGGDVVKLVGTAREARETVPVLQTLAEADVPTIAIAMGEAGLPTRILALEYDACLLTYCALETGGAVAPGQLSVGDLRDVYQAERIGPKMAVYGLLGPHVETERAREYNWGFRAIDADAIAVPLVVPPDGDAAETVAAFRALDIQGYHLHPPHQEAVGQALDDLDPSACRAGKVNAVYARGDRLVGAWVETPAEQFALWTGREAPFAMTS
ncbi:MAG: type I 3-dehydroquinate dehydratase [Chloroflexi bacterium]|nr:type I 3-dehydroquinate dehydratase [Chloroflexota bacterium]